MHHIQFLLGGLLVGSILFNVASVVYIRRTHGTLRIDHTNPEKDVYRFDVDDLDSLSKKKRIILLVDNDANLSQN